MRLSVILIVVAIVSACGGSGDDDPVENPEPAFINAAEMDGAERLALSECCEDYQIVYGSPVSFEDAVRHYRLAMAELGFRTYRRPDADTPFYVFEMEGWRHCASIEPYASAAARNRVPVEIDGIENFADAFVVGYLDYCEWDWEAPFPYSQQIPQCRTEPDRCYGDIP
jgi:hypothetical protein